MNKTTSTLSDLKLIAQALYNILQSKKMTYKGVAGVSGLSVNTVKSIFVGEPANIANYDAVALALGTSLISVISSLATTNEQEQPKVDVNVVAAPMAVGTAARPKTKEKTITTQPTVEKESSVTTEEKPFSL